MAKQKKEKQPEQPEQEGQKLSAEEVLDYVYEHVRDRKIKIYLAKYLGLDPEVEVAGKVEESASSSDGEHSPEAEGPQA